MKIDAYFDEFLKTNFHPKSDLLKTAKTLLKGDKPYSLPKQEGWNEAGNLDVNIKQSVKNIPRGKDTAVSVYKMLVTFLKTKGIEVDVEFPPVPIDSSFERQMFIAKYLQSKDNRIEGLEDILWISRRTVEEDLGRLYRNSKDPIQICGRPFFIPDSTRTGDRYESASTVRPLFLTENLTQVIVMLKGLRQMAEDPLYTQYAEASAADIWEQLSDYAKKRIRFVLGELLPEDLSWYEHLETDSTNRFATERQCSVPGNVWLECLKNDKPFCVEYQTDTGVELYKDCRYVNTQPSREAGEHIIAVECNQGRKLLETSRVIRTSYTIEELLTE